MAEAEKAPASRELQVAAERRIGWLTLALGLATAAAAGVAYGLRAGAGVLVGALLAWVNARWLQQALDALVRVSTAQAGVPKPRISKWLYAKFFARYGLMAIVIYVMVKYFDVPVLSLLGGLLALGAAAMAEFFYESFTRLK